MTDYRKLENELKKEAFDRGFRTFYNLWENGTEGLKRTGIPEEMTQEHFQLHETMCEKEREMIDIEKQADEIMRVRREEKKKETD